MLIRSPLGLDRSVQQVKRLLVIKRVLIKKQIQYKVYRDIYSMYIL